MSQKEVTQQTTTQSIIKAAVDSLINQDHIESPTPGQIAERAKTLCVEYGLPEKLLQDYALQWLESAVSESIYGTHLQPATPELSSKVAFVQASFMYGLDATCSGKEIYRSKIERINIALYLLGHGPINEKTGFYKREGN